MRLAVLLRFSLCCSFPASPGPRPSRIGAGNTPSVAVDSAGTAYIVGRTETGSPPHFCRLPRGAAACDVTLTLTPPGTTLDTTTRPIIQVTGARVTGDRLPHRVAERDLPLQLDERRRELRCRADGGWNVPIYDWAVGPG